MGYIGKVRAYEILESASPDDVHARTFRIFIMALILLNILAVILGSVKLLSSRYANLLWLFEIFSVSVFTLEYGFRVWACVTDRRFAHPFVGRIRFALTPFALIDLLAILPFYLPILLPFDLRFIRIVRVFRVFRLFKMGRYSQSLRVLTAVLRDRKEHLFIAGFLVIILFVLGGSVLFLFENEAQPQVFSSIPYAMWWGVAKIAGVGVEGVSPVTLGGRLVGVFVTLAGRIGIFAVPAAILASGFIAEFQKRREE